jgi:hypothetical protein
MTLSKEVKIEGLGDKEAVLVMVGAAGVEA